MIIYTTPGAAAVGQVQRVLTVGDACAVGGVMTYELVNESFCITMPDCVPFSIRDRGLNHNITRIETISLFAQAPVDELQRRYVKSLARFQDDNVQWGNYGTRIRGQLEPLVEKLKQRGNRQAVLSLYDGQRDLHRSTKDTPCTLTIQFLLRDMGLLDMIVNMRSNDVFLGLPYDLHQFCFLQTALAGIVGAGVGTYYHNAGSFHAYERDFERLHAIKHSHQHFTSKFSFTSVAEMTEYGQAVIAGVRPETLTKPDSTVADIWLATLTEETS